ncbi:MAG TPA: DUF4349 domain-containing protein [Rhodopila sp.]|nr:DUF4349 domain-containing protein [Rhodopila sp.]
MAARATAPDATGRKVAITHSFVVELPSAAVQPRQQKDLAACLAAGCIVLNTRLNQVPDGSVQGAIAVRIAPDKFPAFAAELTAPPARLISHTETAQDETVPLLDIEKRLDAQTALRDRLKALLGQQGVAVADLVAIEKQLADVQGTIESETAQRNYLRTITDTVRVDVSYNGLIQQAGPLDISPVRAALNGFARGIIESLGALITWIAYAIPWLPVAALGLWLLRLMVRPWRR